MASKPSKPEPLHRLSVVIPAYNEAKRIGPTLQRVAAWLEAHVSEPEILVVDDGSRDDTAAVVREHAAEISFARLVELGVNRGKGAAVRAGVLEAHGDLILFSDADLSTPIEDVHKLTARLDPHTQIAIGSRGLVDSNLEVRQPIYREAMGRIFNRIVRIILPIPHRDTQCGFKLFRREAARALFGALHTEGFAFDVEILYRAALADYSVAEVPITWRNDERTRVRPLQDATRMFTEVVRIRRLVSADHRAGKLLA